MPTAGRGRQEAVDGPGFRLLALNVARPPAARAGQLLEYLWHQDADLLILTEVGRGGGSDLIAAVCRAAGFAVHSSLEGRDADALGVLVVGRGVAVEPLDLPPLPVLPERLLAATITSPGSATGTGTVRLLAVYGPASDPVRYASAVQRRRKRAWLEGFVPSIAALPPSPTLIAGDLNIVAPGHRDRLPYVLPEEVAAYDLLTGELGLVDVVEASAPHARTWIDHSGVGCRYDHLLAGPDLAVGVSGVAIDDGSRDRGLSDHSAITAVVGWPGAGW